MLRATIRAFAQQLLVLTESLSARHSAQRWGHTSRKGRLVPAITKQWSTHVKQVVTQTKCKIAAVTISTKEVNLCCVILFWRQRGEVSLLSKGCVVMVTAQSIVGYLITILEKR